MIRAFRDPAFPYIKAAKLVKCRKCGEEKTKEEFYWRKNGKIKGYTCKKCACIDRKAYEQLETVKSARKISKKRWQQSEAGKISSKKTDKKYKNSEKGQAKIKAWEQSEAGKASCKKKNQTEASKARQKKYRQSEAGKDYAKAYSQLEKCKAKAKEYRESEAGKMAKARARSNRRSLLAVEPNTLTKEEWLQILENQNNCCNGCRAGFGKTTPTEDHIIPLGEGTGRTKENIQALCGSCNSIKGTHSMEYLIEKLKIKE